MRYFLFFLLLPVLTLAQRPSNHATYGGISVGTLGEQYLRVEHEVTDAYMILQASAYIGLEGRYGVQYKMGAGYAPKKSNLRVYAYIPYMNMRLDEVGYNTPFGIEAFFCKGRVQSSINIDIYTVGTIFVPSARIRYRFIKFKL